MKVSDVYMEKDILSIKDETKTKQEELASFYQEPWFDKLHYVQELESSDLAMPWSDHVNAIMSIFSELLAVDNSDTFNISFTDFEISLEKISLKWYVTNLRLLYQWSENKRALIQMFEDLDFLNNISIKHYEKSSQDFWYEFVLTANVINNGK